MLLMQIQRLRPVQKDHFLGVCGLRHVLDLKVPNSGFDVCNIVSVLKFVIFGSTQEAGLVAPTLSCYSR